MAYTAALAVVVGSPTKKTDYDALGANTDFLRTTGDADHDFDITLHTGDHKIRIDAPMHMQVDGSTVWSMGWWQASGGSWWLLVRTADVASFVRADANMYIPLGDIRDVPAS